MDSTLFRFTSLSDSRLSTTCSAKFGVSLVPFGRQYGISVSFFAFWNWLISLTPEATPIRYVLIISFALLAPSASDDVVKCFSSLYIATVNSACDIDGSNVNMMVAIDSEIFFISATQNVIILRMLLFIKSVSYQQIQAVTRHASLASILSLSYSHKAAAKSAAGIGLPELKPRQ
nr:MAG TPA_asm: hypothetical protein [Caudoviricetes sp.]